MARPFNNNCSRRAAGLASALLLQMAAVCAAPLDLAAPAEPVNISLPAGPEFPGEAQALYLEVFLNGVNTHRVLHFALDAQQHWHVWPQNLADAGFQLDGLPRDRYLDLAELPGLSFRYDLPRQRLYFEAALALLDLKTQVLNAEQAPTYPATASPGLVLNYDLYGTLASGGSRALSGYTELRGFGGFGLLSSSGLSRFDDGGDGRSYLRLDTVLSRSLQDRMLTFNAGDYISGSLPWTRATRMGGVQLRRNFGLQPGLITFPLPAFAGQAALPSSVELYVNGMRQYSGEVPPGPFQLYTLPNVNGSGRAEVVLTDALGRSSTIAFPFYSSSRLLSRGLSDYSLELGFVRRDYGLQSFEYDGDPAASASLRYGAADWLTLETHAETTRGLLLGGGGAALRLGGAGVIDGSYAYSGGDRDGSQAGLGYAWQYHRYNFSVDSTRSFGDYSDIATQDGRAPPQRSERALTGIGLGAAGEVTLSYTRLQTREEGDFCYAGFNYNLAAGRNALVYIGASRNLDDASDYLVYAGLSWRLGRELNANLAVQRSQGRDLFAADLSRSRSPDGGYGWSLRSQQGEGLHNYQAEAGLRADWGEVVAGALSTSGDEGAYASLAGGLVFMQRDLFFARRVDDAFALVSTGGIADLPVKLENRTIGRTNGRGHYLLTGLNAYQPNRVSIDPLQLPAQIRIGEVNQRAVPADRAGMVVDFGLREVRAALLIMHDAAGEPLPLGSRVSWPGASAPAVVGYDGQVYLEDLAMDNRIGVLTPEGMRCEAAFAYPRGAAGIPVLGPLSCR